MSRFSRHVSAQARGIRAARSALALYALTWLVTRVRFKPIRIMIVMGHERYAHDGPLGLGHASGPILLYPAAADPSGRVNLGARSPCLTSNRNFSQPPASICLCHTAGPLLTAIRGHLRLPRAHWNSAQACRTTRKLLPAACSGIPGNGSGGQSPHWSETSGTWTHRFHSFSARQSAIPHVCRTETPSVSHIALPHPGSERPDQAEQRTASIRPNDHFGRPPPRPRLDGSHRVEPG